MLTELMTPSGRLGYATVIVALLLTAAGVVAVTLATSGVGIEKDEERFGAAIVGLTALLGPAGLVMQVRRPLLGGVLAVFGSCAGALLNAWMILPILIVPATVIIVILRSRRLSVAGHSAFAGPAH